MNKKNNIVVVFIGLFSFVFCGGGEFNGWGNSILHHVADSKSVTLYGLTISKHIIMLIISAIVTMILSILATSKYRKKEK